VALAAPVGSKQLQTYCLARRWLAWPARSLAQLGSEHPPPALPQNPSRQYAPALADADPDSPPRAAL